MAMGERLRQKMERIGSSDSWQSEESGESGEENKPKRYKQELSTLALEESNQELPTKGIFRLIIFKKK